MKIITHHDCEESGGSPCFDDALSNMYSFVDQLRLQGVMPRNILLFGAAAFDANARDVDYMVFDEQNDSHSMMEKMAQLNLKFKCLKSSEFAGTVASVELFGGKHEDKDVDVCVVNDPVLWTKWCCNSTQGKGSINVVSKEIQAESYYHMAKSAESTPIELVKAASGLIVMALLFVEQTRFYKACVGMVDDICQQRAELTKFKMALEKNMVFTGMLVSEVNNQKLLTKDCQTQLEIVFKQNGVLTSEINYLRETLTRVNESQERSNIDIQELKENVASLQRELQACRDKIQTTGAINTSLRTQLRLKEQEIASLMAVQKETSTKNVAIYNSTITSLNQRSDSLNATIDDLKKKLAQQDNDMATLSSSKENTDAENQKLKDCLDDKNRDLIKLTEEFATLNTHLTGLKAINMQYELALKHPSSIMDTVVKQFISDTSDGHDFEEPIGLDGNLLRLTSNLSSYFHLAFITQSTDNIMVFTCINAGFGFAFNMDRSNPCCQMVMVLHKDQHLHVCLSEEIAVEPGMFCKPIEPLVKIAELASSHPLCSHKKLHTSIEAVLGLPKVLSIILQRLCRLNEKSMELAKQILVVDDSLF